MEVPRLCVAPHSRVNSTSKESKYGMWTLKRPFRPTQYYFGTETKPYREFAKRHVDALEARRTNR